MSPRAWFFLDRHLLSSPHSRMQAGSRVQMMIPNRTPLPVPPPQVRACTHEPYIPNPFSAYDCTISLLPPLLCPSPLPVRTAMPTATRRSTALLRTMFWSRNLSSSSSLRRANTSAIFLRSVKHGPSISTKAECTFHLAACVCARARVCADCVVVIDTTTSMFPYN